ncbi:pygopus homolog 1 isoform X2 [Ambystoma mexicanum]|uniref:pygopus homolog 1 isoform X2 n=1 Tax=Ambystoma mexicanum TaxID=8296 RepID=UPI0037E9B400
MLNSLESPRLMHGSSFPPLSEYAPPQNASSDHLIAGNPFDDNYNTPSNRSLTFGHPYFRSPGYLGYGGVRMPPSGASRTLTTLRGQYLNRNQSPQFLQNSVETSFSRCYNFNSGSHDNSAFGKQQLYRLTQHGCLPNVRFQQSYGGNVLNHAQQQNPRTNFTPVAASVPRGNPYFHPLMEPNCGPVPPKLLHNHPRASGQKHNFSQESDNHTNRTSNLTVPKNIENNSSTDFKNLSSQYVSNESNSDSSDLECITDDRANEITNPRFLHRGDAHAITSKKGIKNSLHLSPSTHPFTDSVCVCGICTDEVSGDQDALLCEALCHNWYHRICAGMSEAAYRLLTAEASAVWGCDTCMAKEDVSLMRITHAWALPALNSDDDD